MSLIPIVRCSRMAVSLRFYTEQLGFELRDGGQATQDPALCILARQGSLLFLSSHSGDGTPGQAVAVTVEDVDELFGRLRARGLEIPTGRGSPVHEGPVDQTWGTRELYVDDPDGNTIRFVEGLAVPEARPSRTGSSGDAGQRATRVSRIIDATPPEVYEAFLDPDLLASWLAPDGMRGTVHELEPREGGRFRMSLTYEDPATGPGGKTTGDTDTFHGRFAELVPGERVVQVVEFESDQPGMSGEMRVTWSLTEADGRTEVTVVCEDIPPGIRLEDNEAGSASSLEKLARLVETG